MPTSNQFRLSTEQGVIQNGNGIVFSARVGSAQASDIVAGQAVKYVDVAGELPSVVSLAANTDKSIGFVVYNAKDAVYKANNRLEIAQAGTVMKMTAGGAIAAGARVEVVYTTTKVITTGGTNPVIGIALEKAAADGDLIYVQITTPFAPL
jgi:hypothetical protein